LACYCSYTGSPGVAIGGKRDWQASKMLVAVPAATNDWFG